LPFAAGRQIIDRLMGRTTSGTLIKLALR